MDFLQALSDVYQSAVDLTNAMTGVRLKSEIAASCIAERMLDAGYSEDDVIAISPEHAPSEIYNIAIQNPRGRNEMSREVLGQIGTFFDYKTDFGCEFFYLQPLLTTASDGVISFEGYSGHFANAHDGVRAIGDAYASFCQSRATDVEVEYELTLDDPDADHPENLPRMLRLFRAMIERFPAADFLPPVHNRSLARLGIEYRKAVELFRSDRNYWTNNLIRESGEGDFWDGYSDEPDWRQVNVKQLAKIAGVKEGTFRNKKGDKNFPKFPEPRLKKSVGGTTEDVWDFDDPALKTQMGTRWPNRPWPDKPPEID